MSGYIFSGIFGLLVALLTIALTWFKESLTQRRTLIREKKTQLENLYAEHFALFEKCIRYTESRKPFSDLSHDLSFVNARMRLLSTMEVIQESDSASELLYQWSSAYQAGMPKPIGDSGTVMISSHDSPHRKRAEELFPPLHDQINKMIDSMKRPGATAGLSGSAEATVGRANRGTQSGGPRFAPSALRPLLPPEHLFNPGVAGMDFNDQVAAPSPDVVLWTVVNAP